MKFGAKHKYMIFALEHIIYEVIWITSYIIFCNQCNTIAI